MTPRGFTGFSGKSCLESPVNCTVNPVEFVQAVQPILERKDLPGLITLLKTRWTSSQIASLLSCRNSDARKVAALSLGLVGGSSCLSDLAEQLTDPDPMINQMAEHAMWSVWFRGGSSEANHQVCRGAEAISRGDYEHAIRHFDKAIDLCPAFPEAFNQRALARYLMERYDESLRDCRRAVDLMPIHFGAWAGMGHCHAHTGRLHQAVECYQQALRINPHMTQISQAVEELNAKVKHFTEADYRI
jgi:tetratricopeptide (TPR) repeat protein